MRQRSGIPQGNGHRARERAPVPDLDVSIGFITDPGGTSVQSTEGLVTSD
jgi:hypothetical protein